MIILFCGFVNGFLVKPPIGKTSDPQKNNRAVLFSVRTALSRI